MENDEMKTDALGVVIETKKKKEKHVAMDDERMLMEGEEMEEQSYSKFKTQNEIDPENIEKFAPKAPTLDDLDDIAEFGTIVTFIQQATGIVLIQPKFPGQIYDLDNIVCTKQKQVIGFIVDVVGPIN